MIAFVIARLKEPSTYAGLAGLLAALHIAHSAEISAALSSVLIGAASLASIFLAEKS